MSRSYKVSADMSEKEKAVGGILTFGQAGWLVLGFLMSSTLFVLFANLIPPIVALIIAIPPGAAFGCVFAFFKKEQLSLFTYLTYQHRFKQKNKYLPNDGVYRKQFLKEDELFN